jgi:transposase-like protein
VAVKAKGGMYCPACKAPVAAVKRGHAVRNTIGAAATAGLALKSERWICPNCGGHAYRAWRAPTSTAEAKRQEMRGAIFTALLVGAIVFALSAHSALVGLVVLVIAVVAVSARAFLP